MEKEGVYFHNVSELVHKPYQSGLHLQRFPQHVRNGLSEKGRTKAIQSNGCELRFVTESKMLGSLSDRMIVTAELWYAEGIFFILSIFCRRVR
ncbi:hypothetical protein C171_31641 [Paenibacillus sp. FSL H8-237]|nr:hypothetical protein C171_31641 [Paenibacillus sp. FSL H8-237]